MSILQFINEQLLLEQRFKLESPESIKYKGVHETYVNAVRGGVSLDFTTLFDFVDTGTIYTMVFTNSIELRDITIPSGNISYRVENDLIYPVYTDKDDNSTDITDELLESEIGNEIKSYVSNNSAMVTINRAFDVSSDDPSKSDEDFATTNKGNPISIINKTYFVFKKYLDNFSSIMEEDVNFVFFDFDFMGFATSISYELDQITLIAKPDYKGDIRRANLYDKWWKSAGNLIGNISNISKTPTNEGVEFVIKFKNTKI